MMDLQLLIALFSVVGFACFAIGYIVGSEFSDPSDKGMTPL